VNDKTKFEELTIYSYDVHLKEKRNTRSMKDVVFANLMQNNLHLVEAYINATNNVTSISIMNKYIKPYKKFAYRNYIEIIRFFTYNKFIKSVYYIRFFWF